MYAPDWAEVRRRAGTRPWAAAILAAIAGGFTRWARDLVIPGPDAPSAWTHHYFCDTDGAPLRFAVDSPTRHVCTRCGAAYTGEPWDGAWRARMHDAAAAQAQRAALLIRLTDDARAPAELDRILSAYARDYHRYPPHGDHAGQGRVQPQSLDEAVWAVGLLRAVRWAGDVLGPGTSAAVDGMARAVAGLLRPQVGQVHNIHCWLLAALAECGARLGDRELLAWCRDSEYGAEAQVREGFHAEGLWYEINPHYHYYAVAALLSYREAAGPGGLSSAAALRLSRAITAPPSLACFDTRLPAYGDGWPDCFLGDFAPHAEAARAILPEQPIDLTPYYARPRPAPVRLWYGEQEAAAQPPELTGRTSVAALVFGPDDLGAAPRPSAGAFAWPAAGRAGSFVWAETGIGLLRSARVRLAMRFGPDGGWHDHRDKLNVDVVTTTGWSSLDLGTSGYGAEFTTWLRSPVAHNLVIVNGARQPPHTGRLLEWSPSRLAAESAWAGHVLRRAVAVSDRGWSDEFTVVLAEPGTIEWALHGDGVFAPGRGTAAALSEDPARGTAAAGSEDPGRGCAALDEAGYAWLREVRRLDLPPDGVLRGMWDVAGSPRLALAVPEGFAAYTAVAGGNPTGHPLGVLLLRGHGERARFHATFLLP